MKARSLIFAGDPAFECFATAMAASSFFQILLLITVRTWDLCIPSPHHIPFTFESFFSKIR